MVSKKVSDVPFSKSLLVLSSPIFLPQWNSCQSRGECLQRHSNARKRKRVQSCSIEPLSNMQLLSMFMLALAVSSAEAWGLRQGEGTCQLIGHFKCQTFDGNIHFTPYIPPPSEWKSPASVSKTPQARDLLSVKTNRSAIAAKMRRRGLTMQM